LTAIKNKIMKNISFEDFVKLEIRIGKIISAERVEGSNKLLKLQVDFGFEPTKIQTMENMEGKDEPVPICRQIIAGIGKVYEPESLVGKECPFAFNLEPKILKGLESQGMILCPSIDGALALLHPDKEVPLGSLIK
jgi:tRNA-binding EMAP/Myf-like protein